MSKKEKSFAFTLAEALLTITIIGVTMTLMMRGINRINPDRDKILFIKTYHAMEQVVANIINDPTKYDQNHYSDEDLETLTEAEKASLHSDFSFAPVPEATAIINGEVIPTCESLTASTAAPCIKQENALCYFMADAMNTIGEINCESENQRPHFKTSTGVCVNHIASPFDEYIDIQVNMDPNCNPKQDVEVYNSNTYAIRIFKDGKMSVPETHTGIGTRQETAYKWMHNQTQVKQ